MNQSSQACLIFLNMLLSLRQQNSGTIKIIDSTPIPVCKNLRIYRHKTMKQYGTRSKTTTGWFYGLKLHAVSDVKGKLLWFKFTTANVSDRKVLEEFLDIIYDSIILGDAGYCSKELEKKARTNNNFLLTCGRKNMKKLTTPLHIALLNLRPHIESLFSILKERLGFISSLPRSPLGYLSHYIHCLFGYFFQFSIS